MLIKSGVFASVAVVFIVFSQLTACNKKEEEATTKTAIAAEGGLSNTRTVATHYRVILEGRNQGDAQGSEQGGESSREGRNEGSNEEGNEKKSIIPCREKPDDQSKAVATLKDAQQVSLVSAQEKPSLVGRKLWLHIHPELTNTALTCYIPVQYVEPIPDY